MPAELIAGWTENRPLLLFETWNVTVWADSFEGPSLMLVAQLVTVCWLSFSFAL